LGKILFKSISNPYSEYFKKIFRICIRILYDNNIPKYLVYFTKSIFPRSNLLSVKENLFKDIIFPPVLNKRSTDALDGNPVL